MKTLKYVIIFGLIGSFIGLMIAGGILSQTKKSQRDNTLPFALIGGLAIGIIGGLVIGSKIIEDDKLDNHFGFKELTTYESKVGRKWILQTKWKNPVTTNENVITTEYSITHNTVITTFNHDIIYNHQSTSGAKVFIEKVHIVSVNEIKVKIKKGELKLT